MRLTLVLNAHNLGFLRSCNSAAATARGRIIIFLNNDTRVLPRWLDATVSSFDTFPLAGAVGSKLLYPNGRLQEAGGIVWRDGSAWNYGRGDDPNRPIYTHAREVDYVSGAALAVDAALWRALTGFDEKFAPAYCEDSDLCLRIARAGRKVIYQSEARVLHYEGRTSGTDTSSGVKAYQDINTRKLLLRWHDTLASRRRNGDAPYFERERGVRQRVLVVDATTPAPDQDAGSVTSINTMKDFIALGYKVYFVPEDNFLYDPVYSPQLQCLGIEVAYVPYEHDFKRYIANYGSLFDAVLVFRFSVLEKTLEVLRTHVPKVPILLSVMDLHYLRLEREAAVLSNAELAAEAAGVKSRELAVIEQVDCTLTNSIFEADLLCRELPTAPVYMSPFVYNIEGTAVGFAPRRDCVFVGSYRHPPNVDAAFFFVTSILPMLREHDPGLRIVLVGADPENKLTALRAPGVVLAGHVGNLREVMDSARILVCPLRFGAGVKGKIFTALSYGLPVVSTSCGIEGIALSPDRHVLVADLAADFAASCLRLYHDESLWQALSNAGQEFMQEHHSAHRAQRVLADALDAAWHHKLGVASQVSIQRPADAKV